MRLIPCDKFQFDIPPEQHGISIYSGLQVSYGSGKPKITGSGLSSQVQRSLYIQDSVEEGELSEEELERKRIQLLKQLQEDD